MTHSITILFLFLTEIMKRNNEDMFKTMDKAIESHSHMLKCYIQVFEPYEGKYRAVKGQQIQIRRYTEDFDKLANKYNQTSVQDQRGKNA